MVTAIPRQNLAAERHEQGLSPKVTDTDTLAKVAVLVVQTRHTPPAGRGVSTFEPMGSTVSSLSGPGRGGRRG